jgi:hypothetical protein
VISLEFTHHAQKSRSPNASCSNGKVESALLSFHNQEQHIHPFCATFPEARAARVESIPRLPVPRIYASCEESTPQPVWPNGFSYKDVNDR